MTWLTRLFGLEPPAGGHLQTAEVIFRGAIPGWLLILGALAAMLVSAAMYRGQVSWRDWKATLALSGLRGLILASLLVLIARPVLVAEFGGERAKPIALLIDNSSSMRYVDPRTSAAEIARAAIASGAIPASANPDAPEWQSVGREGVTLPSRADLVRAVYDNPAIDLLQRLEQSGPVQVHLFGHASHRIPGNRVRDRFTADEDRSAIFDAIAEIANGRNGEAPSAVVLFTDGLDNASKSPLRDVVAECRGHRVPVHVYGVGSIDGAAVRVLDAAIPHTIFYDDVVTIPLRWRARNGRKIRAEATVTIAGREITRQEFQTDGQTTGNLNITFVPERKLAFPESSELVIGLRVMGEPGVADELRKQFMTSDRRVRVLVVDNAPRWEFKFLQSALLRDRRVEAQFLLAQGDRRALSASPFIAEFPPRDKLFAYDLVILGDVSPEFLGVEGVRNLADLVREGGGLAVIAGRRSMPSAFADTPLAEVLPVEFVPTRFPSLEESRSDAVTLTLTTAGRRSDMLNLADASAENEKLWAQLPGVYWNYPISRVRPGAVALVTRPANQPGDNDSPVMAVHHYGKGEVLFVGTDETWRWRFNTGDRLFSRLWGQIAYQLGMPNMLGHGRRALLSLEHAEPTVGSPCYIYARILDAEYRPLLADSVQAELERTGRPGADRRIVPVTMQAMPGASGEYRVLLPHDVAGDYELRLQKPFEAKFSYRVHLPAGHEAEPDGLADGPLRELAAETGGGFFREEDLHRLPDAIQRSTTTFSVRREALLWGPFSFCALVGLLTGEWVIRKFHDLS